MAEQITRKLYLRNPTLWSHHRGGWTYAIQSIDENLCCEDGTLLISSVEDMVCDKKEMKEPWVGFVHQVIKNNYEHFPDLERLVIDPIFTNSLKYCRGLFTLSSVVKDYLKPRVGDVPVVKVLYPATPTSTLFDVNKWEQNPKQKVLFIGEFMRNFQFFFDFKLSDEYEKTLILSPDVSFETFGVTPNDSVNIVSYLEDSAYDDMLSRHVVLLNMLDAPANTTVIECITRNTPLVINRLPGLEEYLGADYPLFYTSEEEALSLITNKNSLLKGHEYLKSLEIKAKLTSLNFVKTISDSSIYRCLDVPKSQQTKLNTPFTKYDVSVVICSYKRVYNMERLFQCFVDQKTDKTFEVIVWNNNYEAREELEAICNKFMKSLNLKVIHSTENYYCIIRLAAVSLIRSDTMVICDDDVVPTPLFLQEYMDKYKEYGPNAVLCCRGHRWWQHDLDEERPHRSWTEYDNLRFWDQSKPDTQVHFLHADTCLFPVHILRQALQYPLPSYDAILVDDYWLSFVISHYLEIPIWKIKGDSLFESTPCAEDENIALFLNPRVREQRIKMYIHHMRKGWPNSAIDRENLEKKVKNQTK